MITRDPLKVPCLTDKYWITFPDRNGLFLARTLSMVNKESARLQPLPTYDALPKSAPALGSESATLPLMSI